MSINEQEVNFNGLVEKCAGLDRSEQESYLVRAIIKYMGERYGNGQGVKPLDANVLQRYGLEDLIGRAGIELLDTIYLAISRALLNDTGHHPNDLRPKIVEYMLSDLRRRYEIQEEVGV